MVRKLLACAACVASILALTSSILIAEETKAQAAPAAPGTYKIDPAHSFAMFRITHMNIGATYGAISLPTGTFEETDEGVKMEVILDVNNIDTGNEARDKHLKGPDFFNVKQFPQMTFKSTGSKKTDAGAEVTGDLTIKGTTKSITVKLDKVGEGKGMQGESRVGYETIFTINRLEYGITWNPGAVGNDVKISVAFEAIKQ